MLRNLIFFLLLPCVLSAQDSLVPFAKYFIPEGQVVYKITQEDGNRKKTERLIGQQELRVSFARYGAIELLEWYVPGQMDTNRVLKIDSLQYRFHRDSCIGVEKRKADFLYEEVALNPAYSYGKHVPELFKPKSEELLGRVCRRNYDFFSGNLHGTMTNFKGVIFRLRVVAHPGTYEATSFSETATPQLTTLQKKIRR